MKIFLYLSIFLCVTTPMAAFCADLRLVDPDQNIMDCDFLLEGEIDENTHHEFAQLLQLWVLNDADERVSTYLRREGSARLCLNSLGGSYLGGIELADQILKQSIATAVSKGSVCESACALAFMAGSVHPAEAEQPQVDRKLHPEARLGFHAPALEIPDGAYQKDQVETAYDIALSAVVKLIGLRSESFFQMPESLIKKMLSTPASQMYYIETAQEAVRYGIHVPHYKFFDASVKLISSNICQNAGAFLTDREISTAYKSGENSRIDGRDIIVGIPYGYVEDSCRPWCNQEYCGTTWSLTEETFFISKSLIATYPPETPLRDLSQEPSITFAEYEKRLKLALELLVQDKSNCFLNSSEATITNVQNFTNLRRQAGLNGPVMGQVPLGATVSVVKPGQILNYARCTAACNGTNQNAIKQCIDNNDVWIEVQYNGRRGFLSRKFLE